MKIGRKPLMSFIPLWLRKKMTVKFTKQKNFVEKCEFIQFFFVNFVFAKYLFCYKRALKNVKRFQFGIIFFIKVL